MVVHKQKLPMAMFRSKEIALWSYNLKYISFSCEINPVKNIVFNLQFNGKHEEM
jgi:hypothetical protein